MNIRTGAKMHKARVWEVPITESVICAVESFAELQGYKTLKLTGKNKTQLLPSDSDEEEEYIYNEDYEEEDKIKEEEQLKTYDEVNKNEIDNLVNDNYNNINNENEVEFDQEQSGNRKRCKYC